jgi:hypothetical protein
VYDFIGDIHGQVMELKNLLDKMGYANNAGNFRHAERKAVFLGDFIDRGRHQGEVINIAKAMIKNGAALGVMGNHEYNAIAYFTQGTDGKYLRPHNEKNTRQHKRFLREFEADPLGWRDIISWFKTLPLWLELDGVRVVHACWDKSYIQKILDLQNGSALMSEDLLFASADRTTWQHRAIETLLKGKEIPLPGNISFRDKDNHERHEIRTQWWKLQTRADTYRSMFIGPQNAIPDIPDIPIETPATTNYPKTEIPVFIGHYWLRGQPTPLAPNIACVDYSVARPGGKLVAYRWDGEGILDPSKFLSVERIE